MDFGLFATLFDGAFSNVILSSNFDYFVIVTHQVVSVSPSLTDNSAQRWENDLIVPLIHLPSTFFLFGMAWPSLRHGTSQAVGMAGAMDEPDSRTSDGCDNAWWFARWVIGVKAVHLGCRPSTSHRSYELERNGANGDTKRGRVPRMSRRRLTCMFSHQHEYLAYD